MKTSLRNRVLALTLVLAMLLPNLTGAMPAVQAETTQPVTYGEGHVYDIYDLTGSKTNTVKGTDETWDGQLFDVAENDWWGEVALDVGLFIRHNLGRELMVELEVETLCSESSGDLLKR